PSDAVVDAPMGPDAPQTGSVASLVESAYANQLESPSDSVVDAPMGPDDPQN
ncbi:hypothetical protein SAMN02745121_09185, partial [Nannocystis exedens]